MNPLTYQAARRMRAWAGTGAFIGSIILAVVAPTQILAQTEISYSADPLVVNNDRGGLLRDRLVQIRQLRNQNRPVRIQGNICYSTCTMFIGLANTCVSPNTRFGFHGPSSYGRALDPVTFNRASEIIADHYPPALRTWYMEEARFSIRSVRRIRGSTLIDMGVQAC